MAIQGASKIVWLEGLCRLWLHAPCLLPPTLRLARSMAAAGAAAWGRALARLQWLVLPQLQAVAVQCGGQARLQDRGDVGDHPRLWGQQGCVDGLVEGGEGCEGGDGGGGGGGGGGGEVAGRDWGRGEVLEGRSRRCKDARVEGSVLADELSPAGGWVGWSVVSWLVGVVHGVLQGV